MHECEHNRYFASCTDKDEHISTWNLIFQYKLFCILQTCGSDSLVVAAGSTHFNTHVTSETRNQIDSKFSWVFDCVLDNKHPIHDSLHYS